MFRFSQPINEKRRDEILDAIAKRVEQFGMTVPAIFFLEMNKPLSYIGGQAMHFFAPIVGVFFETFEDYAYFFDDRNNVELLIQKLEAIASKEEEARKKEKEARMRAKAAKSSMLDDAMRMERNRKEDDTKNLEGR